MTAYSVFKIAIPYFSDGVCNMSVDWKLAFNICQGYMIVWDEIVMCVRGFPETVKRTLRGIVKSPNVLFGRKCSLFRGDFRQIQPAFSRWSSGVIAFMMLKSSLLFSILRFLKLARIMRSNLIKTNACADEHVLQYPEYLLKVEVGIILENR